MISAPKPDNETARLEALYRYKILDTPAERVFDEITELAAALCNTPIATITLIDEDREWYKSRVGMEEEQAPRDISFCAHTILQDDLLIIKDTYKDDRFKDNPFVKEDPPLRFYAGVPLKTIDNFALGTLCVMDHVPRRLGKKQINALRKLALIIINQLEMQNKTTTNIENKSDLIKSDTPLVESPRTRSKNSFILEREILSNLTEGFNLVRDSDGIIVHTSSQFDKLFGYAQGELIGKHVSILNATTELQPDETAEDIFTKLNSEGEWSGEIKNIKKDGSIFWCYASVTKFEHSQFGTVWLSVHKDISKNKQAEKKLDESILRFRTAMDNSPIGMALVSPEGRWLEVNKALSQIVGYTREELLNLDFQTITHPDDLDADMAQAEKLLMNEIQSYWMEKRFIHKDGHIVWIQIDVSLVRDTSNQPLYFISQIQDITERRKTEQLLKDSEEKFQKAFVSSPHLMIINRLSDERFIEVNSTFEKSLGYSKEETIGKTPIELGIWVDPERRSLYTELLKKNHSVRNFETTVRTKDGVIRIHQLSAEIFNLNNEPCIVSIGEDITERKQIEESLKKVAEEFAVTSSEEFFRLFTKYIGDTLEADYVIVGELSNENENYIESVSVYHHGKFLDPITYERQGSPCDTIIGKCTKSYANNVQDLFPEFTLFAALNIEGYVGAPLFNSKGEARGIIALFFCNPVNNIDSLETLLGIFAIRTAAELERSKMENDLRIRTAAFDIAAVGFVLTDATQPDNPIIYVNKGFLDLTGYSEAEVLGKNCRFLQGPDSDPDAVTEIRDALIQGKIYRGEILNYRKDASPFWNLLRIEPYYNQEGNLTYYVGTQSDITVQKNVEEALLRNEKHLRFLYEENPSMYFTLSSDGTVLMVNSFGAEELGYTVDELIGESILKVFPDDVHNQILKNLDKCKINFGQMQKWQTQKICKDGKKIWVKETARCVGTPDGGTAILVVCRDYTELKNAENRLRLQINRNEFIGDLGRYILSQSNIDYIFKFTLSSLSLILDVEFTKILELQTNEQGFILRAGVGWKHGIVGQAVVKPGKKSQAGYTLYSEEPVIVHDLEKETRFKGSDLLLKHGIVSGITVAIKIRHGIYGVLGVHSSQSKEFTQDDVSFVKTVANMLGEAIERNQAEKALYLSNRALTLLNRCNEALIHATEEMQLLNNITQIISDTSDYLLATVAFVNHDENKTMRVMSCSGKKIIYLENIEVQWGDDELGSGPWGTAVKTGRTYISKNLNKDPQFSPWLDRARKYGLNSQIALPLFNRDQVFGVLAIYAEETDAFDINEIRLLEDLASNLAFGIIVLRTDLIRQHAQEQIKKSQQSLRKLTTRLQDVREDERTRIAREIHDHLGQSLTGLKMDLSWIHKHLPKPPDKVIARIDSMISLVDTCLEDTGKLAFRLRPAMLDDLGLETAIEWEIKNFAQRANCMYKLDLKTENLARNKDREIVVFRILQEALTNIARHAKATEIYVSMYTENANLVFIIEDNGVGIDEGKIDDLDSLGILGMSERALTLNGNFYINRIENGGTRILLKIPV